ncbi:MAG: M23 family metallopeptidase [Euzebyaceae bacterium]|jgi:septal ring factor EnvC (AmiA/AmiB activator)|nr:M23 family metallopeptidase [Euzebyaceae bacterium]
MPTLQRLRLHVVVLVMLVATIGVVLPATADPVLPEEQRLADIRAKIATVRQEISAAKATKHRDAVSFANAQRQLAVVMNALAAAEQAVQRQQQAVDEARVRLATLRAREAQQRGVMADRAVTLYKRGGMDSLTTVLGSDSATHALRRSAYVDAVNRADARSVQRVMSTQTAVDAQRIQLRVEQEALQRVAAEQRQVAAEAEVIRDNRAVVLAASSSRVNSLQTRETHLEAEGRRIAALARRAQRMAAASRSWPSATSTATATAGDTTSAATGSATTSTDVGTAGWTWPAGGTVTSEFGYRWGRLHAGLDIGAPEGSPIWAARAGTVTFAGAMGGYGNLVLLDHGGGVSTAYAHQSSIMVSAGASVSAGQQIGQVGSTGNSTGPHLHFETRIGGSPQNPRSYLP